ncbi:MAG: GFA family protein [Deltaproteobacteria bacterium]|nr:GFA family protein [Deltaproteobacteria bacterium]
MRTGSCLCGSIRYAVKGPIGPVDHCHCSMCRRAHGAPFSTFGRIRRSDLELTAGAELLTGYASSEAVVRSFCARCGSRLFFRHAALPEHEFVTTESLDDAAGIEPEAHIFVGSKASWYTITDALPQHEGYPFGDD